MPSLWSFAGGGLSNYLLVIVSGFIFVVVALQLILSRVGRTKGAAQNDHNQLSPRDWAAGEFVPGPAQRRASGSANRVADCCSGVGHDSVRHRVSHRRTRRHLAI